MRRALPATLLVLGVLLGPVGPARAGVATSALVAAPAAADAQLPVPVPTGDDPRQVARDIVSGPAYQEPPKSAFQKVLEWIGEQFAKVFSAVGGVGSAIVTWGILLLLAGLVVFFVSRMQWTGRVRRDDLGYEFDLEDRRSPGAWQADAEAHEARGEWKAAMRCRFRALVGELIELGALRDIPGRTTGEYRVELRRFAPDAAAAFASATDLFERAWYGDEATGPAENQRVRALAAEVLAATRVAATARASASERVGVAG